MITQMGRQSRAGLIAWALVVLLAVGGTAVYFVLYPEELPEWASKTPIGRDLQTTTVYKWQDASGAWHVSDRPPAEAVDYQVENYARDANVLPPPPELRR